MGWDRASLAGESGWVGVYSTDDGGKSWQVSIPNALGWRFLGEVVPKGQDQAENNLQELYFTIFASPTLGYWSPVGAGSSVWPGTWETRDGGLTWDRIERRGFLSGFARGPGEIIVTIPGDAHRNIILLGDATGLRRCGIVQNDLTPVDAFFIDRQIGWAINDHGAVLSSRDGGCTWRQMWSSPPGNGLGEGGQLFFASEAEGWAVGGLRSEGVVWHSTDGGHDWHREPVDYHFRRDDGPTGIAYSSHAVGWLVVGYFEKLLRTDDGGGHWREVAREEETIELSAAAHATSGKWQRGQEMLLRRSSGCP
jgi:photosystem II stability/assembly factor-like uncharacterized protein